MPKYCGLIGFAETVETAPGIWEERITERRYYGDVLRNTRRFQNSDGINDNINISNEISIISDPYASRNLQYIRCVEFMGAKWKISNVEVQFPRLILTIGDVYNEP